MSFYDSIRSRQHIRRNRYVDLLSGFQIDEELKLSRLLDGNVGGLGTLQDLVHVISGAIPLWQEAVAADAVAGGDPGTSFELLLGLADAAHAAGLHGDAQEVVNRALALAEERRDAEQVVRALDAFAGHGVWIPFQSLEESEHLVGRLENALDRLHAPAQVLGRGVRMMLWGALGDEEAIAVELRALHAESATLDRDLSRRVAYHAVVACRGPGLTEERGLAAQWLAAWRATTPLSASSQTCRR